MEGHDTHHLLALGVEADRRREHRAERSKARVRIGVESGGGKDIMPKNGTKGVVTIDFPVRACLLEVSHFLLSLHTRSRPT